ncbi:uncharacterized protein LOC118646456 [Monomorium pharaonis]|uniref:uncharacterized protein LOC118646456 n=1 Tax=Monomorium pharaonis TaxID=307658 RepID=UPI001746A62E|nr:uncharacterized protein LOC118646456 [Monomorium pharaonis]
MYNQGNWEDVKSTIAEIVKKNRNDVILIGGDFNIRIGELSIEEEALELGRKSKDKTIGNNGRDLVEFINNIGGYIWNGTFEGDREGEYTYIGARSNTVIGYVITCENCIDRIISFSVVDRVDSDHMSLTVKLDSEEELMEEDLQDIEERRTKTLWDLESRHLYEEKTEVAEWTENLENDSAEEIWKKLKKTILEAMVKKEIRLKRRKIGYKEWWNKSCSREKRKAHRALKSWKKGKITREVYLECKGNLKEFLDNRYAIWKEEEELELRNLRNAAEVWKRGNEVTPEEDEIEEGNEKEEGVLINEELIGRAIDKLKNKKAPGLDGISMEAWKYGGAAIRKGLTVLIKKIWLGDSIPEDWKAISLEEESMELKALPESQGNFREGRGTMENIFILNHVVQREKLKEDKKVFALFVDLKAAFDNIKRKELWNILEEIDIKKQTTRRLKKVYEETKAVVKTEGILHVQRS